MVRSYAWRRAVLLTAATALVLPPVVLGTAGPASAADRPRLGTAAGFALLAGSGITNSGETDITGDIGSTPTSTQTGTDPCTTPPTSPNCINHNGSQANSGEANQAKADFRVGYADARDAASTGPSGADIGNNTMFSPGVYTSNSSIQLTGDVILDAGGVSTAVFIFQAGSTFITASNSRVVLQNGASACNVFFQVGSSATLGTGTTLRGTILANVDISVNDSVTVTGRLLAGAQQPSGAGAITLINNRIAAPSCSTGGSTGGSTTGATTGSTTGGTTGATTGATTGSTTAGTTGGGGGAATGGTTGATGGTTGTTGGTTGATTGGTTGTTTGSQVPDVPVGGIDTGGGSTAVRQGSGLFWLAGLLLAIPAALGVARLRRRSSAG